MNTVTSKTDTSRLARVEQFLASKGVVTTGVHSAEGETDHDGPTIAQIAEWAEFGLGQPQRSWLRAWFDENKDAIEKMLVKQLTLAFQEGETFEWGAERFALWVQASIQRRIRNKITPPNAASTVRRKKSSTPLIDTGLFRASIVSYFNEAPIASPRQPVRKPAAKKPKKRAPRKKVRK